MLLTGACYVMHILHQGIVCMPIIYTFVYCLDLYTDIVKKPKRRPEEEYMQCTCARSGGSRESCERECICRYINEQNIIRT